MSVQITDIIRYRVWVKALQFQFSLKEFKDDPEMLETQPNILKGKERGIYLGKGSIDIQLA